MPLAEAQGAGWATTCWGDYALPERRASSRADIAADQAAMRKRYVASKRHTIQVDYDDYLYDLAKERRAGAERARVNGYRPPADAHLLSSRPLRRALPDLQQDAAGLRARGAGAAGAPTTAAGARRSAPATAPPRRAGAAGLRVRREERAAEDGYSSPLMPGVRASADAPRLAEEIAFSSGRLLALRDRPRRASTPSSAAGGGGHSSTRTWIVLPYRLPLARLQGDEPFAASARPCGCADRDERVELGELSTRCPSGHARSHDPARGTRTLLAYRQWVQRAAARRRAFSGDPTWSESGASSVCRAARAPGASGAWVATTCS